MRRKTYQVSGFRMSANCCTWLEQLYAQENTFDAWTVYTEIMLKSCRVKSHDLLGLSTYAGPQKGSSKRRCRTVDISKFILWRLNRNIKSSVFWHVTPLCARRQNWHHRCENLRCNQYTFVYKCTCEEHSLFKWKAPFLFVVCISQNLIMMLFNLVVAVVVAAWVRMVNM
jgi:hypothetical protein